MQEIDPLIVRRRRRRGLAAAVAIVAASAVVTLVILEELKPAAGACAVCKRSECRALAFRIRYADGLVQETCCPRCASHAVAEEKGRVVASLEATDFTTGARLDAHRALYVDGSDFEHCSAPKEEPILPGCCAEREYDRCLPSLIAFASKDTALAFMNDHGGSLETFDDLRFGAPSGEGRGR
jgi:hypothetical protein